MVEPNRRINRLMQRVRQRGGLPSSAKIVKETFERLGYTKNVLAPEGVIIRFNELLRSVWEETLPTLERYEELSYSEGIPRELIGEFPDKVRAAEQVARNEGFRAGVMRLFAEWYPLLRRSFLSISQSRMQRGGKDFELQIEGLLELAEVPYHRQERQNRTDLILPDLATFHRNRNVSAVVSVKRTLRERWAEVAEELFNLRSPNVFLFTADENVSANHVRRICDQYNIHLVVWDTEKQRKFPRDDLVLSYTQWAVDRLTFLKQNW